MLLCNEFVVPFGEIYFFVVIITLPYYASLKDHPSLEPCREEGITNLSNAAEKNLRDGFI